MNNLVIFNNENFGKVRTLLDKNNNIYFVAKDVSKILGYTKLDSMYRRLSEKHKIKVNPQNAQSLENSGFPQIDTFQLEPNPNVKTMVIISESGLYKAIMGSTTPDAERFQDWVVEEVLPQIRQTGGYIPINKEDDEQELLAKAFLIAQKTIEKKEQLLQQANKTIEEQKPLVELAKDFIDNDGFTSVDDFAKNLAIKGLGRNNMYKYLRENKILRTDEYENPMTLKKAKGENHHKPYSKFINEGKFVWKPTSYNKEMERYNHKPFLTVKGVEYMLKRLKNEGYLK